MRTFTALAFGVILGSVPASPAAALEPNIPAQLLSRIDALGRAVETRLAAPFRGATPDRTRHRGALLEFYAARANRPLWVDENGPTPLARKLAAELERAGDYGLDPEDYDLPALAAAGETTSRAPDALAEIELQLSHAALAYARHARGGRFDSSKVSRLLDPTLELPEPGAVMRKLAEAEAPDAVLRDYQPKHPQFEALRQLLMRARGPSGSRERIHIPDGPILRAGQTHAQVTLVRRRLGLSVPMRDGAPAFDPEVFDSELELAVEDMQRAKGLTVDGIIGPATRRAMNTRARLPVKTILANMERWRWIPREIGKLHVRVNVPEFRVRVFEDGTQIHVERVVVGKLRNKTPIFSDAIESIVFNPYWNVPNSIKVEEILPYLKRGGFGLFGGFSAQSAFMRHHNLYVKYQGRSIDPASVDWNRVDVRRFHFYQPPGGPNVLGNMKFVFPNKHSVYMHDTLEKFLFEKTVRAYSHGCMRVRNPERLAQIILSRDAGWSAAGVARAIRSRRHQPVRLKRKVPVHITYFTAWVDEDGRLRTAPDLYGHDTRMVAALRF